MTTVLRQRTVMAQSLTSLSWLAQKSLGLHLIFSIQETPWDGSLFLFPFLFMSSSFPPYVQNIRSVPFRMNMHSGGLSALEMATVISPSGSGICSCDLRQSLTRRPRSHLEVSRDRAQQVDGKQPTFPLWHLRDPLPAYHIPGLQCQLCFSNEYQPPICTSEGISWTWWLCYVCLTTFVSWQISIIHLLCLSSLDSLPGCKIQTLCSSLPSAP